jgi:hypothetical protein
MIILYVLIRRMVLRTFQTVFSDKYHCLSKQPLVMHIMHLFQTIFVGIKNRLEK